DRRIANLASDVECVITGCGWNEAALVFAIAERNERQAHHLSIFGDFRREGSRQTVHRLRTAGGEFLDTQRERIRLTRVCGFVAKSYLHHIAPISDVDLRMCVCSSAKDQAAQDGKND